MKPLVVVDTNIIVSALLSKHADAATVQVIQAMYDNKFIPVLNDEILAEYDHVLHRDKFGFPESIIQATINYFKEKGISVHPLKTGESLPDPKALYFMKSVWQSAKKILCS